MLQNVDVDPKKNWNWIASTGLLGFIILFRCSGYFLAHVPKPENSVILFNSSLKTTSNDVRGRS
ncbi:hypothetical protein NC651_008109 [Populus alba x Populus x berolinensis]|nr:hypothetical protein NC651_008109 [Populus alba x Populus x berolinensis]